MFTAHFQYMRHTRLSFLPLLFSHSSLIYFSFTVLGITKEKVLRYVSYGLLLVAVFRCALTKTTFQYFFVEQPNFNKTSFFKIRERAGRLAWLGRLHL